MANSVAAKPPETKRVSRRRVIVLAEEKAEVDFCTCMHKQLFWYSLSYTTNCNSIGSNEWLKTSGEYILCGHPGESYVFDLSQRSSAHRFLSVWLKHDAIDVFDDVEQAVIMKEDIWISGVRALFNGLYDSLR